MKILFTGLVALLLATGIGLPVPSALAESPEEAPERAHQRQPPNPQRDQPGPPWMRGSAGEHLPGRPPHAGGQREAQRREAMQEWMERLRAEHPEEFERLERLRQEDPRAFFHEIRERHHHQRFLSAFADDPEVRKHLEQMPPEARQRLINAYGRYGPRVMNYVKKNPPNPEIKKLEQQNRRLAKAIRNAKDDEERGIKEARLRANLEKLFDLQLEERRAHLKRLDEQLKKLRHSIESQNAKREAIVGKQLKLLTGESVPDS